MSATPAGPTPGDPGYIRGWWRGRRQHGSALRLLAALCVLVLIALTGATTVSAANQNSRAAKLRSEGTPVDVTVTGCVGISSGIAQAVQYYQCRGAYTVEGQRYNEVIGGVRLRPPHRPDRSRGHRKASADPALVTTVGAAKKGSYTVPIVLGALAGLLIVGLLLFRLDEELPQHRNKHFIGGAVATGRLEDPVGSAVGGRRAGDGTAAPSVGPRPDSRLPASSTAWASP